MFNRTLFTVLLGLAFTGSFETAEATSFRKMSHEEVVEASDLILRGTVMEIWTETSPAGVTWTRVQVEVEHLYKGELSSDVVIIDQMGGTMGGLTTRVEGAARFSPDEEVLLFLDVNKAGYIQPIGMMNGKYTIMLDPHTRTEVLQRFAPSLSQPYDHRFIPLPNEAHRNTLSEMEAIIAGPRPTAGGK